MSEISCLPLRTCHYSEVLLPIRLSFREQQTFLYISNALLNAELKQLLLRMLFGELRSHQFSFFVYTEIRRTSRFVARKVATNRDTGGVKDCSLSNRSQPNASTVCSQRFFVWELKRYCFLLKLKSGG